MAGKKIKKNKKITVKQQPTVIHESSADNEQNLRIKVTEQEKNEQLNLSHRRGHNGSDGADQERGSNH
jgi:hypothetical protein